MALGKFVRLGSGLVPFTSLSPRRTGPHLVGGWLRGWQAIHNNRSTLLRGLTNHGPWLLIAELGWSTKQCLAEMEPFRQGWHYWLEDLTSDVGERWMDCNVVCTRAGFVETHPRKNRNGYNALGEQVVVVVVVVVAAIFEEWWCTYIFNKNQPQPKILDPISTNNIDKAAMKRRYVTLWPRRVHRPRHDPTLRRKEESKFSTDVRLMWGPGRLHISSWLQYTPEKVTSIPQNDGLEKVNYL